MGRGELSMIPIFRGRRFAAMPLGKDAQTHFTLAFPSVYARSVGGKLDVAGCVAKAFARLGRLALPSRRRCSVTLTNMAYLVVRDG